MAPSRSPASVNSRAANARTVSSIWYTRTRRHRRGRRAHQEALVDQCGRRAKRVDLARRLLGTGKDCRRRIDRKQTWQRAEAAERALFVRDREAHSSRRRSRSWSGAAPGHRAGRPWRAGRRCPAGGGVPGRSALSSTAQRARWRAAGHRAAGRSRPLWNAFAAVSRKSGCTPRTRSTNRRTAGHARQIGVVIVSDSTSRASVPTRYSRSPRTRSAARLVASTRSDAAD